MNFADVLPAAEPAKSESSLFTGYAARAGQSAAETQKAALESMLGEKPALERPDKGETPEPEQRPPATDVLLAAARDKATELIGRGRKRREENAAR